QTRTEAAFAGLIESRRAELVPAATALAQRCLALLEHYTGCRQGLAEARGESAVIEDLRSQLSGLVHAGSIATSYAELDDRIRYLKGLRARLQRRANDPVKDARKLARVQPYAARLQAALKSGRQDTTAFRDFHRQLEEFRLSVFAPEIKTVGKVSEKSLDALLSGAGEVL
ncbi:MAG: DUF3418 domain-containing protein, partial [Gammaproteobacteria bacterium]|nr:DUF3418 domain-containing protein [Gammaproteobacteria bacterium]